LNAIRKEFLAFIESSIKNISEERKQLTAFVSEIGENLIRMESHLFHSLDSNRRFHEANRDFNHIIEVQMADMKQSVNHSTTLGELKNLVVTKISTICLALEAKRQEDERRLHEADEKVGNLQGAIEKVKSEIEQVQERARNLERQALVDPLTNSYNRRAYEQRLKEEFQRYQRYGQGFSLLLLDVDNFKNVNDRYGHSAGDLCLREVIQRVRSLLRVPDFLARFGGDEMVVILPGTGREEMKVVAEKIHSTIERTRFFYQGKQIPIRVSVGGTQIEAGDRSGTEVFNRADKALYAAKSAGRNNVTVF
jgi:diguanylate cyclase (GGDEF)-like protein